MNGLHGKRRKENVDSFNAASKSKRLQIDKIIKLAKQKEKEPDIYFPHQLDFRGRAYPIPMFLNPQGIEYSRALLEFSKGERMSNNADSARWLAIHGANQYGEDKCSLDDRVKWVKDNQDLLLKLLEILWVMTSGNLQTNHFVFLHSVLNGKVIVG